MSKTVVIAAGGTGGHLFPAQVVAEELQAKIGCQIHFMAKGLSTNARFDKKKFSHSDISSSTIGLKACINIPRGIVESMLVLRKKSHRL